MSTSYKDLAKYLYNLSLLLVQHSEEPINSTTIEQSKQYIEDLNAIYPSILEKLSDYSKNTLLPKISPISPSLPKIPPIINNKPQLPTMSGSTPKLPLSVNNNNLFNPIIPGITNNIPRVTPGPTMNNIPRVTPGPTMNNIPRVTPVSTMNNNVPTPYVNNIVGTRTNNNNVPTSYVNNVVGTRTNNNEDNVPIVRVGDVGTHYSNGMAHSFTVTNVSNNGKKIIIRYEGLLYDNTNDRPVTLVWKKIGNKTDWYLETDNKSIIDSRRKWGSFNTYKIGVRQNYDTTG